MTIKSLEQGGVNKMPYFKIYIGMINIKLIYKRKRNINVCDIYSIHCPNCQIMKLYSLSQLSDYETIFTVQTVRL